MEKNSVNAKTNHLSRRTMLQLTAAMSLSGTSGFMKCTQKSQEPFKLKNHIRQSFTYWCFEKYWNIEKMCLVAKKLGLKSIELVPVDLWPVLKNHNLLCALAWSHPIERGMNNPQYHERCIQEIRTSIDTCSAYGFPNVLTFTGFREKISDEEGKKHCIDGYKKIIGYAEKKNVNLCLEIINSRVDENMKGRPGYQGDHMDYCMDIIQAVGSGNMKFVFDIYHVQVMDGDIISRIKQNKDYIGHYQTAGNPGRNELNDNQEINYKPIMQTILKTGYSGFVGHEFIPTSDPLTSLKHAIHLCDI